MVDINDLPNEILEFIISLLPPYKDLQECAFVCRRWSLLAKNVLIRKKLSLNRGIAEFNLHWKLECLDDTKTPKIAARFAHSTCLYDSYMYVFGGASSSDTTFNDLWRFDLSKRVWERPLSMGTYPSPKAGASLVCHRDVLILFGGWRHSSNPPFQMCSLFEELHGYNIKTNRWTIHNLPFGPPPMTGHSATIQKNRMIIFGGYQKTLENHGTSNDVWELNLSKLAWRRPTVSDVKPAPRYGQFQVSIDADHLLILGGNGGPNNILSDAWLLDMTGEVWRWRNIMIKNKKFRASQIFCYPTCKVESKLIVLGPTTPNDFQLMRPNQPPAPQQPNPIRGHPAAPNNIAAANENPPNNRNRVFDDNRRAVNNNNPRDNPIDNNARVNPNQQPNVSNDARQSRNPLFRHHDDDHLLPKRFNQPNEHGHMGMAAFNVPNNHPSVSPRERQLERLRKMEEKISAMRRANETTPKKDEMPKRIKRNGLAIFICDISKVLSTTEPCIEWLETKSNGILAGAPDKFTFSSIVNGTGEMIMFGGLLKNALSEVETVNVSNSVHILTVPTAVI